MYEVKSLACGFRPKHVGVWDLLKVFGEPLTQQENPAADAGEGQFAGGFLRLVHHQDEVGLMGDLVAPLSTAMVGDVQLMHLHDALRLRIGWRTLQGVEPCGFHAEPWAQRGPEQGFGDGTATVVAFAKD